MDDSSHLPSQPPEKQDPHIIYILSGGSGASGEQLVHTVLAQFPNSHVRVTTVPHVRSIDQVEEIMRHAQARRATVVHTLVDSRLRNEVISLAARLKVPALDLMGELIGHLEPILGESAREEPGLYRKLNQAYFERVVAIEYTMSHDDGQRPDTWEQADIVLVGVSRVGKTPLSLYLSVLGWKVANIPLVPQLAVPETLSRLDWKRVFGLKIAPAQLLAFRQERQRRLGTSGPSDYTNPQMLFEELEFVEKICRQAGYTLIDVTDKPIETSADEIMRWMERRFGTQRRRA